MKLFSGCHRIIFFIAFLLYNPLYAYAGEYLDSAHGDSSLGVNRTADNNNLSGYSIGNCAHCHEQHASIDGEEPTDSGVAPPLTATGSSDYMLFADTVPNNQTTNFCFFCHKSSGIQSGGIVNYNYSTTFGGQATASGNTTLTIYDAFNPVAGSTHSLVSIYTELNNLWPLLYPDPPGPNPCVGCHNPHIARKNNGNAQPPLPPLLATYDPSKAAISPAALRRCRSIWKKRSWAWR